MAVEPNWQDLPSRAERLYSMLGRKENGKIGPDLFRRDMGGTLHCVSSAEHVCLIRHCFWGWLEVSLGACVVHPCVGPPLCWSTLVLVNSKPAPWSLFHANSICSAAVQLHYCAAADECWPCCFHNGQSPAKVGGGSLTRRIITASSPPLSHSLRHGCQREGV
jgi:hypothetical protein